MSNTALWSQATHTLTLIGQQDPSSEHIKELHDGRLTDLLKAIQNGTLPDREVTRKFYGLGPVIPEPIDCNILPQTPSWADQSNPIVRHTPGGIIDPSKLIAANVFADGDDVLEGEEFMKRAQKPDSMNACAFDFYSKLENWKYIPEGVDVLVFANTMFRDSDGRHCVRCLCRNGAKWVQGCDYVGAWFSRSCRVARLAS